ncbi:MAG TPA: pilus assembly protein N-terminal domain-containing protein [Myxococcales bacterium]
MLLASTLSLFLLAASADGPATAPTAASAQPDAGTAAPAADSTRLVLGVRAQKVLPVSHLKAVAVAAPEVLDVRALNSGELLLVGLAAGHSDLTVFHGDGTHVVYQVEVAKDGPADDTSALRSAFKDSPNLAVQLAGDRIFLTGLFGSLEDYEQSLYFPRVVCLAKLDPKVVRSRVAMVNDALARSGLKHAQAVLHGPSTLALEGLVQDSLEKDKAQKIADAIFGPVGKAVDALEKNGLR